MKRIVSSLVILFLTFTTCTEKAPTSPIEEAPQEVLAEATIGPNGGILETDDFKLVVPDGAFLSNTNLKLYVEPEEDPFGEFSVSKIFYVKGIPSSFQNSIEVKIKYSGSLNGVNFIALGIETTIEEVDTSFVGIVYDLFDADDVDGFLTSEIINQRNNKLLNKTNDDTSELRLAALTNGTNEQSGEHFKIKGLIPKEQKGNAAKIIEYFEEAYTRFKEAGFDYSNVNWPLEIQFINEPKIKYLTNTYCYLMQVTYYETIILSNKLRGEISDEFITQVLHSYLDWHKYLRVNAISVWARYKFGFEDLPYDKFYLLGELIVEGLSGYNFAPKTVLLDYIAENKGEKAIGQLCNIKKEFVPALAELMGNPKQNDWLIKFYEYIMTSNKYKDMNHSYYIENSHVQTIINPDFNKRTFTNDYSALSAKWHHIELGDNLNENTKLRFFTSVETSGISVFKYKFNSIERRELVKSGYGEVSVTDIKQLKDEGYNLFAIVTNNEYDPPDRTDQITLFIEKNDDLIITGCSVFLRYLTGDYIKEYPIGTFTTISDASLSMGFPKDKPDAEVNFSGRVLTQKYTDYQFSDGYYYSGDISITFGEDDGKINMDYISSVTAKWKRAEKLDSREHSNENELSAINIPIDKSVSYLKYKFSGEDICSENKIVSLDSYENNRTVIYTLINGTWKCNEDSELEVYISTE